ncbi:MAG: BlaI/MecI/CopY family transcriptional regulator [Bacteroidia bacterium]
MSKSKLLTPLELKVMNLLWRNKRAYVKDLVDQMPVNENGKPPAYNTISTMVRILEEKDFVGHRSQGRSHEYYPLITQAQYQKMHIKSVLQNVFSGSRQGLVSTLLDGEELSDDEVAQLKNLIDDSGIE